MTTEVSSDGARGLQGRRAGFVTRFLAAVVDAIVVSVVWAGGLLFFGLVRFMARPSSGFHLPRPEGWATGLAVTVLFIAYLTAGWTVTGRSIGKRMTGLRVTTGSGTRLTARRALPRAALCVVFPIGLVWVLVSSRNRSVAVIILGTAVIYDWGLVSPAPVVGDLGRVP